jgi:M6 family metalloprotease-like protein
VPPLPPGPGYAPTLAKPAFADDRSTVTDPWVGEWGPKTDPYFLPGTGHLRGLIVPIDFSDAPATRTVDFYRGVLVPPATNWYREASFGRLSLDLSVFPRWVRMSRPIDDYGLQNCCPSGRIKSFFQELVAAIDPEVDFTQVDAIYAIAPESAGPHMSILLFRRWPGDGITADGRELRWGVVGNGNFRSADTAYLLSHYAITHETGHLLGLADLYGRECPTCPDTHDWVGAWSMMDWSNPPAAHFLGWDKWLLGWLDPQQIVGLTQPGQVELTLAPIETPGGPKLVVVPTSGSTAYVVEVRAKAGEDVDLCKTGVLVYSVDSSVMNGRGPVRIRQAQPSDPARGTECGPIWNAPFGLGPGEVSSYEDAAVKVEVVQTDGTNYTVRVTRK